MGKPKPKHNKLHVATAITNVKTLVAGGEFTRCKNHTSNHEENVFAPSIPTLRCKDNFCMSTFVPSQDLLATYTAVGIMEYYDLSMEL